MDSDYNDMFENKQFVNQCYHVVFDAFERYNVISYNRKWGRSYVRTLLKRYASGNFDNMPTEAQAAALNENADLFLYIDKAVREKIKEMAGQLHQELAETKAKLAYIQAQSESVQLRLGQSEQYIDQYGSVFDE